MSILKHDYDNAELLTEDDLKKERYLSPIYIVQQFTNLNIKIQSEWFPDFYDESIQKFIQKFAILNL